MFVFICKYKRNIEMKDKKILCSGVSIIGIQNSSELKGYICDNYSEIN